MGKEIYGWGKRSKADRKIYWANKEKNERKKNSMRNKITIFNIFFIKGGGAEMEFDGTIYNPASHVSSAQAFLS